jgi:hypothetical protein
LRKHATAATAFVAETEIAFGFPATEFGLTGPELTEVVLPVITYTGQGFRYQIMFDAGEMAVFTRVGMALETKDLVAELPNLVQAAGLGARNHVTETARTVRALQQTLAKQADYLKLLHPRLTSENAVALMRAANAGERNRS